MSEVVELKFTVSKLDNLMTNTEMLGMVFYGMRLTRKSQEVVTDRLLVSDEEVRVLDLRR